MNIQEIAMQTKEAELRKQIREELKNDKDFRAEILMEH